MEITCHMYCGVCVMNINKRIQCPIGNHLIYLPVTYVLVVRRRRRRRMNLKSSVKVRKWVYEEMENSIKIHVKLCIHSKNKSPPSHTHSNPFLVNHRKDFFSLPIPKHVTLSRVPCSRVSKLATFYTYVSALNFLLLSHVFMYAFENELSRFTKLQIWCPFSSFSVPLSAFVLNSGLVLLAMTCYKLNLPEMGNVKGVKVYCASLMHG